jgi:hypothetical protein
LSIRSENGADIDIKVVELRPGKKIDDELVREGMSHLYKKVSTLNRVYYEINTCSPFFKPPFFRRRLKIRAQGRMKIE